MTRDYGKEGWEKQQKEEQKILRTKLEEIGLSCQEVRHLLGTIPLKKKCLEMKETAREEFKAVEHYIYCKTCRDQGLEQILAEERRLSCQQAILVWAEHPGPLYHHFLMPGFPIQIEALDEIYAVEHVYSKYYYWDKSRDFCGYRPWYEGCRRRACLYMRKYWEDAPLSAFNDGEEWVMKQIPWTIRLFEREGWPLDELLAIQEKRLADLKKALEAGMPHPSRDINYHTLEEIEAEIRLNLASRSRIELTRSVVPRPTEGVRF